MIQKVRGKGQKAWKENERERENKRVLKSHFGLLNKSIGERKFEKIKEQELGDLTIFYTCLVCVISLSKFLGKGVK